MITCKEAIADLTRMANGYKDCGSCKYENNSMGYCHHEHTGDCYEWIGLSTGGVIKKSTIEELVDRYKKYLHFKDQNLESDFWMDYWEYIEKIASELSINVAHEIICAASNANQLNVRTIMALFEALGVEVY